MNSSVEIQPILNMMRQAMNGTLPRTIELAQEVMPELIIEHGRSREFTMPSKNSTLSPENQTLIYLGIAIATGSEPCIDAMYHKAKTLNISDGQLLETFKIARYAAATKVMGHAEKLLENILAAQTTA